MKLNAVVTMFVFAACVAAVQSAWAFPTQAEIKTATDVVGDLGADDVRAANAGKQKREDVADKLVGLVDCAESDAAKWVLYKYAFIQYAKDITSRKRARCCPTWSRCSPTFRRRRSSR